MSRHMPPVNQLNPNWKLGATLSMWSISRSKGDLSGPTYFLPYLVRLKADSQGKFLRLWFELAHWILSYSLISKGKLVSEEHSEILSCFASNSWAHQHCKRCQKQDGSLWVKSSQNFGRDSKWRIIRIWLPYLIQEIESAPSFWVQKVLKTENLNLSIFPWAQWK